ncbi:spore coat protein U domain-containing protein [Pseudomonas gingeri]|uniref:Spore coat protein U domain-containing protein n=1 Tax=Pseudomonas gingeri TaxID=117681 RepID=A0A7Y7X8N6_9PSED|nr:spore coat U domain-containing protein [Pseudomonas gingeri]NWB95319.1 spore coat protein U domain-containing protein [Pseudomonas gingeri]NWD74359.1 spore coat protein U domain-containing protein [Pseudomonas gingeri]
MKSGNHALIAVGSLFFLSDSALAVITGQIQARLVISSACEVSSGTVTSSSMPNRLDFGSQGPTWTRPLSANLQGNSSNLQVACNSQVTGFTVTIDGGANGDGISRYLSNGRQTIPYRLFIDAGGTDTYSIGQQRNFAVGNGNQVPIPVYGAVVANTNALPAGTYSDTLTVTLDW